MPRSNKLYYGKCHPHRTKKGKGSYSPVARKRNKEKLSTAEVNRIIEGYE